MHTEIQDTFPRPLRGIYLQRLVRRNATGDPEAAGVRCHELVAGPFEDLEAARGALLHEQADQAGEYELVRYSRLLP